MSYSKPYNYDNENRTKEFFLSQIISNFKEEYFKSHIREEEKTFPTAIHKKKNVFFLCQMETTMYKGKKQKKLFLKSFILLKS